MPSDSHFAIAMKNQQEAERAEQQRIKNLVLSYDLQGSTTEQSGIDNELYYDYFSHPNPNLQHLLNHETTVTHNRASKGLGGDRLQHNASLHQSQSSPNTANARPADSKPGTNRRGQQARKLQLSDVDWYDRRSHSPASSPQGQEDRRPRGVLRSRAG